jgi:ribonucrease Y
VTMEFLVVVLAVALAVIIAILVVVIATMLRRGGVRQTERDDQVDALTAGLEHREELLADREARLSQGESEVRQREAELIQAEAEFTSRKDSAARAEMSRIEALEKVAGLSVEAARAELLVQAESTARLAATQLAKQIEAEAREQAERGAREVIVTAMQRVAAEQTLDAATVAVALPGEEMKGRLIGRDGRNIRSFEQVTGASLVIDDTPGMVELSCFDPLRREVARQTLTELIADGRIHPGRIEQTHAHCALSVEQGCLQTGTEAAAELGIADLDPEILEVLGALKYRTSYGQNVLAHLVESGRLAGLLAAELGLDVAACRRAAFLHDLGKALPDDGGSHALAGAEFARRHGEDVDITHAIEAHHNEVEPATVEAVLVQVADAMSGSRPGARRESTESYAKRLEGLEQIASADPGVERVFAVQAGHEVRVMVRPDQVDDAEAELLATRIAKRIEAELNYPGSIKVTVVRESRATAVAR